MSTGLIMMLKSLGLDPKMMETVAQAVQNAARDLNAIKLNQQMLVEQNKEILARLRALTPEMEYIQEEKPEESQLALVHRG
jgi:endonuclease/exonuclease/phosphatase (EEP) superfamily protein YafD